MRSFQSSGGTGRQVSRGYPAPATVRGVTRWRTWRSAAQTALYGEAGFFRRPGTPARHFRTSPVASPLYAGAVAELARRVDAALGEPDGFTVVDVGAGGGELLAALAAATPGRWRLLGVDLAARPAGLAERVAWREELPEGVTGLLLANEWLDNVPVDVAVLTADGPHLVEVDDAGDERPGPPLPADDAAWLARWWPLAEEGDRAEVGRPRDAAWADAVRRTDRGLAVAVDYRADPRRHVAGTLTGYRAGRQVVPVPDGSCDLTAHVLLESCAAAGEASGADETVLTTQREALRALGVRGTRPAYGGDPAAYLAGLSRASQAAELTDPAGLGGFGWLLQARGVAVPLGPQGPSHPEPAAGDGPA